MAVQSFASLYTEDDFKIGEDGSLKVTKGTFINTLDVDSLNANQRETINGIFESLAQIWNNQIIVKSKRLSMSIPSKGTLSNDSETKEGPIP